MTTQVFDIYIKAPVEKIWEAITNPERNAKYGYRAAGSYELRPGGSYRVFSSAETRSFGVPEIMIDGEVVESRPPHKLVHTYRWLFNEEAKAEGFTCVTWEIVPTNAGFSRLTVTHDLEGAPAMAAAVRRRFNEQGGGGWNWILSDLKSLLETGKTMAG